MPDNKLRWVHPGYGSISYLKCRCRQTTERGHVEVFRSAAGDVRVTCLDCHATYYPEDQAGGQPWKSS